MIDHIQQQKALQKKLQEILERHQKKESTESSATKDETSRDLDEFYEIYNYGFRHSYAELEDFIGNFLEAQRSKTTSKESAENLEGFVQDLKQLLEVRYEDKKDTFQKIPDDQALQSLQTKLFKLYDHINLSIKRKDVESVVQNLKEETEKINCSLRSTTEDASKLKNQISSINRDTLQQLGLFTAIIALLITGVSFGSEAFKVASSLPHFFLTFCTLACFGFNAIACLIYLLFCVHREKEFNPWVWLAVVNGFIAIIFFLSLLIH